MLKKIDPNLPAIAERLVKAQKIYQNRISHNTAKNYSSDWRDFVAWCESLNLSPLPASPQTIILYLSDLADCAKFSTIRRRIPAIRFFHDQKRLPSPTLSLDVKEFLIALRKSTNNTLEQKKPFTPQEINRMCQVMADTLIDLRDKLVILIGIPGFMRRSEIVNLEVNDLKFVDGGIIIKIHKSKTDQEGKGQYIPIPRDAFNGSCPCPVQITKEYLSETGITEGRLIRRFHSSGKLMPDGITDKTIANIVKKHAQAIGLDPGEYSGHSLRCTGPTQAIKNGARLDEIMEQGRWKDPKTAMGYIRKVNLIKNSAANKLG